MATVYPCRRAGACTVRRRRTPTATPAWSWGTPSMEDAELIPYAENPDVPLDTVYAYVPVEIVDAVMEKHGGIAGPDFSNGTDRDWSVAAEATGGDAGWRLR